MKSIARASSILLVVALAQTLPLVSTAQTSAQTGPVPQFQSGNFYPHLDCLGRFGTTAPAASFPTSTPAVFLQIQFSQWQGSHSGEFDWNAPDGTFYRRASFAFDNPVGGPVYIWDDLPVAFFRPASMPGTWTVKLLIDSKDVASGQFTLVSASAPKSAADYCTASVRPEAKGAAPDYDLVKAPLKQIKSGQKARFSAYYNIRNLAPSDKIKITFEVFLGKKRVKKKSATVCKSNCRSKVSESEEHHSRSYLDTSLKKTGSYTLRVTLAMGSQKQKGSASFKVVPR